MAVKHGTLLATLPLKANGGKQSIVPENRMFTTILNVYFGKTRYEQELAI